MRNIMKTIGPTLGVSALLAVVATACRDEHFYRFGYQAEEMAEEDLGSGSWRYRQTHLIHDRESDEDKPTRVETVVTTDLARGARTWDAETITYQGRQVAVHHDDVKKEMTITVDGRSFNVRQQPNGKFLYKNEYYGDDRKEVRRLAQAIADDLLAINVPKDGLVGNIAASREAAKRTAEKDKLFFTDVHVDVLDNVEEIVGIEAGAIPVDVDVDADADVL